MSTYLTPLSGYVIRLEGNEELKTSIDFKYLDDISEETKEALLKTESVKDMLEFFECDLGKEFLGEYPTFDVFIHLGESKVDATLFEYDRDYGERGDDLDDGYYFEFNENQLYEKKLTTAGELLEKEGSLPYEALWTAGG
jgi:hypothetical protein